MAYENILVDTKGPVGLITLNRPDALNALNAALMQELAQARDEFEGDERIGAIVLTGSDKPLAADSLSSANPRVASAPSPGSAAPSA